MSGEGERYNGWANYETWCVNLWLTNDQGSYNHWRERAQAAFDETGDKHPNEFANHEQNARIRLADELKEDLDEGAGQFLPEQLGVYHDLLNHALGRVEWFEIADAFLEDVDKSGGNNV